MRRAAVRTVRIFISSPGDVSEERERARQVIESLRRRYAGKLELKPVLWEDLPLQATASFQEGIDLILSNEQGIDIAVFILWSRLGSPLGVQIRKPDGDEYRSGTEREFELMLRACEQNGGKKPTFLVYTRQDEVSFEEQLRGKSTEAKQDLLGQKKLVEKFIAEEFLDDGSGHNVRAYHSFDRPVTFSQRLRTHLQGVLDEITGAQAFEAVWDVEKKGAPFMGLDPFGIKEADVFCGRESETLETRRALGEQARKGCSFLLLCGASGSGKSSLARAGLIPAITENEIDETVAAWRSVVVTPSELGTDPIDGLVKIFASPQVLPELRTGSMTPNDLAVALKRDAQLTIELKFKDAIATASRTQRGGVRLILLIDQLEEVFSSPTFTREIRTQFLMTLEALARSGFIWVVATVRSDFLSEIQEEVSLVRLIEGHGLFPVLAPDTDALRRIIEEPARLAGLRFEERSGQYLGDRILADAAAHADLLPLLEYVLRELFDQRTDDGTLSWKVYDTLGGVEGALALRAEEVFKSLSGDEQAALDQVLKSLVTVGEIQGGVHDGAERFVRQRASLSGFAPDTPARRLVNIMVEARLFTASADEAGNATVAVTHEALLRVWPRAIAWTEKNNDFIRTRARVVSRMREKSSLMEGDPLLEMARSQLARDRQGFKPEEVEFIESCAAAVEERKRRRAIIRRNVMVSLVLLTLAALVGGVLAGVKAKEAISANEKNRKMLHEASMADLAIAGQRLDKDKKWHEGVAHLVRSLTLDPENRLAVRRLYETLYYNAFNERNWPVLNLKGINCAIFSPDGSKFAFSGSAGLIKIYDLKSGKFIGPDFRHGTSVPRMAFSPDEKRILTTGSDNTIRIWDISSGQQVGGPIQCDREIRSVMFSPDGSKIVATKESQPGKDQRTIQFWDASSGKSIGKTLYSRQYVDELNFSPDGSKVVLVDDEDNAQIWDAVSGEPFGQPMRHAFSTATAVFSPDGSKVLTTGGEKDGEYRSSARLWNAASGKPIGSVMQHDKQINSAIFSPDGSQILTASYDKTARLWNASDGKPFGLPIYNDDEVQNALFSPDGSMVLTNSLGVVRLWDASSGNPIAQPMVHPLAIRPPSFSPDGSKILTSCNDGLTRIWDVSSGSLLVNTINEYADGARFNSNGTHFFAYGLDGPVQLWETPSKRPKREALRHRVSIKEVYLSSDNSELLTQSDDITESQSSVTRIWSLLSNEIILESSRKQDGAEIAGVSPDWSKYLKYIAVTDNKSVQIQDVVSLKSIRLPIDNDATVIRNPIFNSTGDRILTLGKDRTARLWTVPGGEAVGQPLHQENGVDDVDFTADGSKVVTRNSRAIFLWSAISGNKIGGPYTTTEMVFSGDGLRAAYLSAENTIEVINATSGNIIKVIDMRFRDMRDITKVQLNSDGTMLLIEDNYNTARLIDVFSGEPFENSITSDSELHVGFLSHEKIVAAMDGDNLLWLWDSSGQQLGEPLEKVLTAFASHDGTKIVTINYDGGPLVRVWDVKNIDKLPTEPAREILSLASAIAGLKFGLNGKMQKMSPSERLSHIDIKLKDADEWEALIRWVNSPFSSRTIAPDSPRTLRQAAERERDFGTKEGLDASLVWDTTVPLSRLLLAKFEKNPKRAAFLRKYDLERLPKDAGLWSRAALTLLDQNQIEQASNAAARAMSLDSALPAAKHAFEEVQRRQSLKAERGSE